MAANAADTYVFSTLKLTAIIGGVTVEDIVSISGTFALNTIPTASIVLACGKNTITNKEASVHTLIKKLKLRAPVKVYLDIDTTDGKKEKNPSGKMLIFEGYYSGFGFQRAQDNAQYTLHLVHWLDDLNIGSMLSRRLFPGAPFDFAESANAGSGTKNPSGIVAAEPVLDISRLYVRSDNIADDFWAKTLKPIFIEMAEWPQPDDECDDKPPNNKDFKLIVDTLAKIPGAAPNPGKLPLELGRELNPDRLADAVHDALNHTGLQGLNYTTYWGAMVGIWGANFMFGVSPGVDFANVIPLFGGLQWRDGGYFKTIKADEYGYASFMANTGQILEGIDIFWNSQLEVSGIVAGTETRLPIVSICEPLGLFPPKDQRDHSGTVLVKEGPAWLANYLAADTYVPDSTGVQGQNIGDTTVPWWGTTTPAGGKERLAELQKQLKDSRVLDKFAEQWYKNEILQQRYGELSGKLRFDIAPGSIVKIEAPRSTMDLSDTIDMIATVVKVSFVINAEQAAAGTSFTLSHIRSTTENDNPLFTNPKPPIYTEGWAGGPLVSGQRVPGNSAPVNAIDVPDTIGIIG